MTAVSMENPPRPFKLIGGQLSLDFTNTVAWRGREIQEDNLNTYQDLLDWSTLAGIIGDDDARELSREGSIQIEDAKRVLDRAVELREAIYRVFSTKVSNESVSDFDLVTINRELREALTRLRLSADSEGYTLDFGWGVSTLDRMLWTIVRAASDLLTSEELSRVSRCASDDCGWLFIDTSKNRSRRWCDMKDCGNRSKARRFYERKRGTEEEMT